MNQNEHYTFQPSDKVTHKKVTFKNRYGIILVGNLYAHKSAEGKSLAAIAINGAFGAVKEQSSGTMHRPWKLLKNKIGQTKT